MEIDEHPHMSSGTGDILLPNGTPMDPATAAAAIAATLAQGLEARAATSSQPPAATTPEQVLSDSSLKPSILMQQS
jgi:hypothetical protein